ncbi:solute carrier family 35 member C2 isoform X1 [Chelonoidis abingdonii]|uniref:solute carrier family 35 member C2 isoform X1 n=1 Tax=Chelonoidis abingdonii TaxID=106734 RepID=UPI003F49AD2D
MHCCTKRSRVVLTWADYLRRVAPTALSTALDIGLSNWSFLYITVSLYTMTKSSAILFILLFSLIFKLEELRMALVLVVLLIAGGLFMFTYESTQFNMEGFALVLGASFLGGIRWTLTQMLMQKAELGLQNPIDTMFHLQPLMFLGLFPLFAVFEGLPLSTSEKLFRFHEAGLLLNVVGKLSLGGFLAFGLGFSEFLLVSRTSSLTLSIAGIFKVRPPERWCPFSSFWDLFFKTLPHGQCWHSEEEAQAGLFERVVHSSDTPPHSLASPISCPATCSLCFKEICTLLLATHLLGDHLNLLNWVGFAVCLSGISLHVTLKAFSSKGEKESKLHKGTSSSPDLELLLQRSEAEEEEEEAVTELQH